MTRFTGLAKGLQRMTMAMAVSAACLALPAAAQVASPEQPARLASAPAALTDAQVAEIMATAIPVEQRLIPGAARATQSSPDLVALSDGLPRVRGGTAGRSVRATITESDYLAVLAAAAEPAAQAGDGISAQNYGTGNRNTMYHFNDYLLMPQPIFAPYRSVGALFFQASDGGWYHCTATLIDRAVLLTAGHCVFDGGAADPSGWNLQGFFVPGYSARDGSSEGTNQRYGRCDVQRWWTTTEWYNTGELNGGYDVAMATCGRLHDARWAYYNNRIPGIPLGYLGFCHFNCRQAYQFMTQLGYPANYYGGGEMTVSQHLSMTGQSIPGTGMTGVDFIAGSGMRGGSSGGPHIANIGVISDSSFDPGQFTTRNVVFAVTSWGFTGGQTSGSALMIQGSTPLSGVDNDISVRAMFNAACRHSRSMFGRSSCRLL